MGTNWGTVETFLENRSLGKLEDGLIIEWLKRSYIKKRHFLQGRCIVRSSDSSYSVDRPRTEQTRLKHACGYVFAAPLLSNTAHIKGHQSRSVLEPALSSWRDFSRTQPQRGPEESMDR
ncbi:hypothetical protein RRG08_061348 [Elysia crispata]|uniref:Uncharacterized protein n=1 Tax=Elysia crispata TaxID=231223 RepID=A0AAE1DXX9_9GAST|nr:hypothetical protein RRG08_061348 [Elysia crispata]